MTVQSTIRKVTLARPSPVTVTIEAPPEQSCSLALPRRFVVKVITDEVRARARRLPMLPPLRRQKVQTGARSLPALTAAVVGPLEVAILTGPRGTKTTTKVVLLSGVGSFASGVVEGTRCVEVY